MTTPSTRDLAEVAQDFLELLDVAVAKPYTIAELWRDARLKDKHRELNALVALVLAGNPGQERPPCCCIDPAYCTLPRD